MCCIFTCCGWMIDLIQRFWTFAMSCCISSAVCCALITASMSGIAMGYNYSLAEYIDLKETNVSVYLKRGVFDDEIGDDADWRRSGHMPVEGHLRDSNLMTAGPDNEEMPQRAARRMDDSLVMSDDQHKFEGSLMRLTVKPPAHKTSLQPASADDQLAEVLAQHPSGSIDQIKAIHSLMNQRRANIERNTKRTPSTGLNILPDMGGRRMEGIAPGGVPMYHGPLFTEGLEINKARLAVPDRRVGNPENWFLPKNAIPESYRRTMNFEEDYPLSPVQPITRPQPIIFTMEMKRPTRPKPDVRPTPTSHGSAGAVRLREEDKMKGIPDDEMQIYKEQMLRNKENIEQLQHFRLRNEGGRAFKTEDDYADQANRGVPVRKKRGLIDFIKEKISLNPPDAREKLIDKKDDNLDPSTVPKPIFNNENGNKSNDGIDDIKTGAKLIEDSVFTLHTPIVNTFDSVDHNEINKTKTVTTNEVNDNRNHSKYVQLFEKTLMDNRTLSEKLNEVYSISTANVTLSELLNNKTNLNTSTFIDIVPTTEKLVETPLTRFLQSVFRKFLETRQ